MVSTRLYKIKGTPLMHMLLYNIRFERLEDVAHRDWDYGISHVFSRPWRMHYYGGRIMIFSKLSQKYYKMNYSYDWHELWPKVVKRS